MQKFEIEVENHVIGGRITHRSRRLVRVTIDMPFDGLSSSCTVPVLGAGVVDLEGKEGDEVARDLLRSLYRTALFLDQHRARLQRVWQATERELEWLFASDPDAPWRLEAERKEALGDQQQRELAGLLRQLRHRRTTFEERVRSRFDFFRELVGTGTDLEEVLAFLGIYVSGPSDV